MEVIGKEYVNIWTAIEPNENEFVMSERHIWSRSEKNFQTKIF